MKNSGKCQIDQSEILNFPVKNYYFIETMVKFQIGFSICYPLRYVQFSTCFLLWIKYLFLAGVSITFNLLSILLFKG